MIPACSSSRAGRAIRRLRLCTPGKGTSHRSRVVLGLVIGLGLTAAPCSAQDADQLRRELEQIKQ
jgi:hypothetical protein